VLADVKLGYYTAEEAAEKFGVVLMADGVDEAATERLRGR
jgi:N-methylhydantoinase B